MLIPPAPPAHIAYAAPTPLDHIVVILQEGRSLNNLFADCAPSGVQNLTKTGKDHTGGNVSVVAGSLVALGNPQHTYTQQLVADDCTGSPPTCAMDGFDLLTLTGGTGNTAYSYIPASQVNASPNGYCTLAHTYSTSDATFAPAKTSVWPSFLYAIAGQSGGYLGSSYDAFTNNHLGDLTNVGCYATGGTTVGYVPMTSPFPGTEVNGNYPCLAISTIFSSLDSAGVPWKYYCNLKTNRACAPAAISSIYNGSEYTNNVITPETQALSDCNTSNQPAVMFITPNDTTVAGQDDSDDAFEQGSPSCSGGCPGPNWVSSIINACGPNTKYWGSEVIILTWVNAGNWYDNQPPPFAVNPNGPTPNPLEYGQRIPYIVISPFAKPAYVDHTPRTLLTTLRLIESMFPQITPVGALEQYEPDNGLSFFDWSRNRNWF